jgi:hypothetical protein
MCSYDVGFHASLVAIPLRCSIIQLPFPRRQLLALSRKVNTVHVASGHFFGLILGSVGWLHWVGLI